jgi:hypothetical protein
LAYWIVATCQEIGVVGVQTLDTDSGAADPSAGPVAFVISRDELVALGPVGLMGSDQGIGINSGLSDVDRTRGLESAHDQTIVW